MKKFHVEILITILGTFLYSCQKETNLTNYAYVGTWETPIYIVQIDEQGSLVNRRMTCTFEPDSFMNTITMMLGHLEEPLCAIKGTIVRTGDNGLYFEVTELGNYMGTIIEWSDTSGCEFDTLLTEYVNAFMDASFNAVYEVTADNLNLVIPATNDTLILLRQ
jgi:hypothetical protein